MIDPFLKNRDRRRRKEKGRILRGGLIMIQILRMIQIKIKKKRKKMNCIKNWKIRKWCYLLTKKKGKFKGNGKLWKKRKTFFKKMLLKNRLNLKWVMKKVRMKMNNFKSLRDLSLLLGEVWLMMMLMLIIGTSKKN